MTGLKIPFTGLQKQYHNLRQEILDVTDQVLRSGQVMNGNWTAEFEHWLSQRNRTQYAITCHSGTQALEVIATYYAQEHGNVSKPRVMLPALTYPATANAWWRAGWNIHFVDVDRRGIMDLNCVPEAVEFEAVCPVGLYGASLVHIPDYDRWRILNISTAILVEDAAQHWLSANCVRIGYAAAISFDPTKNLGNFGNGGAVLTNNVMLAEFARQWRDNGRQGDFHHNHAVTNSRMSEVDCAQMMVKTRHLDQWQQRRSDIARHWMDRLRDTPMRCLIDDTNVEDHCFHKFVIDTDQRDRIQEQMTLRRVETRIHYSQPLTEMGAYQHCPGPDMLSKATALSRRVLSLPIYPELTDLEVEYIIDQLRDSCAAVHS
jgi:dTDP-4-amino-4,6-dideoxygalactose transaminase